MSRPRTFGVAAASVVATLGITLAGQSVASVSHHGHAAAGATDAKAHMFHVPAPPAAPTSDRQFENIDQVRAAIKAYYGDTTTSQLDPVNGTAALHTFDPAGAYAHQVTKELTGAKKYLGQVVKHGRAKRAIVLDVDDTSLNTYDYEIYSNFAYNPTTNAAFVNAEVFPAVPGMTDLADYAKSKGITIFFLTGRPGTQREATEGNLTKVGFPAVPDSDVFLKDYTADTWLSSCAPTCSTTQYKSLTRQHIQSLGYTIVGNFGDQASDLNGGFAKRTFKLPNPMYYLP